MREQYADEIRARYPDIPRRVSGYNLDSLLPEHNFDVAGLLVGSESTLVTVLRAELELVPVVKYRALVVLGFDSIAAAADAVPAMLPHEPIALEGLDHRLIRDQRIKKLNADALAELPRGDGYLMVQFGGENAAGGRRARAADARRARRVRARRRGGVPGRTGARGRAVAGPRGRSRRDRARARASRTPGKAGRTRRSRRSGSATTCATWRSSTREFGYADDAEPALYGHFGQGCVHTRIPFRLTDARGVDRYREFLYRAAALVASYGGSLSGEHGDGQSRGELLPIMFGEQIIAAFGKLKAIFDPDDRMNPGKVVAPARADEHLRLGGSWAPRIPERHLHFAYPEDGGSFVKAANRCVGVGKCRQHSHQGNAVMCPSYQATQEEEHSTRGRARLLFEMLERSPGLADQRRLALDRGARRARPVPGVQGLQVRLPGGRGHGHLQGGVPVPPLRGPAASACALRAGLAAAGGGRRRADPHRASPQRADPDSADPQARHPRGRSRGPRRSRVFAHETLQQWWVRRGGSAAGVARHGDACGRTPSPTTSTRTSAQAAVERARGGRLDRGDPDPAGLLRAHLDLHRSARRRQEGAAPHDRPGGRRTSGPVG